MFDSLAILYLETQNSFCLYGVQFAAEIKDLRPETSENFPSGGKRFVEAMKHYCRGWELLKPLSTDRRRRAQRFLLLFRDWNSSET
ncbi:hypothetical protein LEMLEM_LOCUS16346 [Lemmus lemmus]